MKSSLANSFFSSQMFPCTCLIHASTCLKTCTFLVCKSVKCIDNSGLQFLKMSHSEGTGRGCWDAGLQIMPGVIISFMMNRNTNTSVGKICGR